MSCDESFDYRHFWPDLWRYCWIKLASTSHTLGKWSAGRPSQYHYLNGGLANPENDGKLQDELYAEEVFNPNAAGLKDEFSRLIRQFKPAVLKSC